MWGGKNAIYDISLDISALTLKIGSERWYRMLYETTGGVFCCFLLYFFASQRGGVAWFGFARLSRFRDNTVVAPRYRIARQTKKAGISASRGTDFGVVRTTPTALESLSHHKCAQLFWVAHGAR